MQVSKQKFCIKILVCKHYFGLLNTFNEKRQGSGTVRIRCRILIHTQQTPIKLPTVPTLN
jgi:hypothetical protein